MAYTSIYFYIQFISSMSYNFLSTGLLVPWLDLFLGVFFLYAIVNGIVFLVSFSDSSLLVYKNATGFYIFILYPATILNLYISSGSFLVESLGFSLHIVSCHLQIVTVLLTHF